MKAQETSIPSIVVIDPDARRRASMYRVCSELAYTVPAPSLAELGRPPAGAWIVTFDEGDAVAAARLALGDAEMFHPVLAYCDRIDVAQVTTAFHSGAVGYLPFPCDAEALRRTIAGVTPTATWWGRLHDRHLRARAKLARLTEREREVIGAIRAGLSTKDVARALEISPRTVEIHRSNGIAKLGVTNSVSAATLYVEAELAEESIAA